MTQGIQGARAQDDEEIQTVKPVAEDLAPYRQLIELQKQMIELVRQHEKTKHECAALRTQLMDEMTRLRRPQWSLRGISRAAAVWLKSFSAPWRSCKETHKQRNQRDGSFLSLNLPNCRKVLDCASPLALLALRWNRQRQRAAAVQDTAVPARVPLSSTPPRVIRESSKLLQNPLLKI